MPKTCPRRSDRKTAPVRPEPKPKNPKLANSSIFVYSRCGMTPSRDHKRSQSITCCFITVSGREYQRAGNLVRKAPRLGERADPRGVHGARRPFPLRVHRLPDIVPRRSPGDDGRATHSRTRDGDARSVSGPADGVLRHRARGNRGTRAQDDGVRGRVALQAGLRVSFHAIRQRGRCRRGCAGREFHRCAPDSEPKRLRTPELPYVAGPPQRPSELVRASCQPAANDAAAVPLPARRALRLLRRGVSTGTPPLPSATPKAEPSTDAKA